MLQAIWCATSSETSDRKCRKQDILKLHARTTLQTCLSKLLVRSNVTPRSFRHSLTTTPLPATLISDDDGSSDRAWRWAVPMMMASDLLPFSSRWLRRNQCWRQLMQRESRSREPRQPFQHTAAYHQRMWWLTPNPRTTRPIGEM